MGLGRSHCGGGETVEASIRPASAEDAAAVQDCVNVAYSRYVERIGKKPAPALKDYAPLIEDGKVWVLVEGREVLGMLTMRTEEDHLSIETVAVWPDRQGEGLGRRLIAFVEEETRNRNLSEIRLYTNEKMWENLAFYERLGFEETERRLEEGYRRVFMSKRLGGHPGAGIQSKVEPYA